MYLSCSSFFHSVKRIVLFPLPDGTLKQLYYDPEPEPIYPLSRSFAPPSPLPCFHEL